MPLVIPPGYGEAILRFNSPDPDGSQPIMTFGVALSDAASVLTAQAIYDAWFTNGCSASNSSAWVLNGCRLRVGDDPGPGPVYDYFENQPGGESGDPVPAQCAVLIKKASGLGGKPNRGRMYHPGLRASHVASDGTVNPTTLSALAAAYTAFLSDLATADVVTGMVLLHSSGFPVPAPTAVTSLDVEGSLATQRRRARR